MFQSLININWSKMNQLQFQPIDLCVFENSQYGQLFVRVVVGNCFFQRLEFHRHSTKRNFVPTSFQARKSLAIGKSLSLYDQHNYLYYYKQKLRQKHNLNETLFKEVQTTLLHTFLYTLIKC